MAKLEGPLCMSHLVVFALFQFLAFYPYLITATGKKFYPEIDEPREYVIQIAIKFSDGGEVLLDRDYKVGDKKYDFYQVVPIEELLAKVNGIQGATYVPIDGKDKRIDLETKLAKGAALHFDQPIRKIRVSEEVEDGGADKAEAGHGKQIDFHIPKGAIDIKSLVTKLAEVDWRWYTTGKHEERLKHVFQSLYDGHAMVALSERVPDPNNPGEEKLEEVARYLKILYKKRMVKFRRSIPMCEMLNADAD